MDQGSVFDEPMWDLQDIDGDGIPELLISSGETQNDYLYISYYDNGDLRTVANAYAVSQLGEYGVMGLCREEHLLGWKKSFDSLYQTYMARFDSHQFTNEVYGYDPEAPSYGGSTYTFNGKDITEEEYTAGVARYNSKNWITVGRQYRLGDFSPLMNK